MNALLFLLTLNAAFGAMLDGADQMPGLNRNMSGLCKIEKLKKQQALNEEWARIKAKLDIAKAQLDNAMETKKQLESYAAHLDLNLHLVNSERTEIAESYRSANEVFPGGIGFEYLPRYQSQEAAEDQSGRRKLSPSLEQKARELDTALATAKANLQSYGSTADLVHGEWKRLDDLAIATANAAKVALWEANHSCNL